MKMSQIFILPLHLGQIPTQVNYKEGVDSYKGLQASIHAVNNHDALVECLSNAINSATKGDVLTLHRVFLESAILLDKIKGDSDE